MSKRFVSDVDIDFGDRADILQHLVTTPAAIRTTKQTRRHGSGVHVTDVPYDPIENMAAIDYHAAEERGYVKLDFLNVWIYKLVRDEAHLVELMREPDWSKLQNREFFDKLIQIGNSYHYETFIKLSEPVNSIPRLAMFISLIRPGKKHLIGKTWREIAETIWDRDEEGYSFKRSHAVAYAHLVAVHMNLLAENPDSVQSKVFVSPE
jgi:hypothetical protein